MQPVELVGDLLARVLRRAAHHHAAGEIGVGTLAEERLLVADAQRERHVHGLAAVLLRKQRHFHAAELEAVRALVDVVLRGIEGFRDARVLLRLEVLHHLRERRRRRDLRAQRVVLGQEEACVCVQPNSLLRGHEQIEPQVLGKPHSIPRQSRRNSEPIVVRPSAPDNHSAGVHPSLERGFSRSHSSTRPKARALCAR